MRFSSLFSVLLPALLLLLILTTNGFAAVPLYQAVDDDWVTLETKETHGFSAVTLEIENNLEVRLVLDPVGTAVEPVSDDMQRLSLASNQDLEAKGFIVIDAGATWVGLVNSACMDSTRAGPQGASHYSIVNEIADSRITEIMMFWRENPDVSQGEINSAVWGFCTLSELQTIVGASNSTDYLIENAPGYGAELDNFIPAEECPPWECCPEECWEPEQLEPANREQ